MIDRSQEKLNSLKESDHSKECATQYDLVDTKDAGTTTEVNSPEAVSDDSTDYITEGTDVKDSVNEVEINAEDSNLDKDSYNLGKCQDTLTEKAETSKSVEAAPEHTSHSVKEDEKSEANEKSEDSGVDTEEGPVEDKKLSKSPSEKNIKNKILSILQDAKALENTKNVRSNYGRNFEFQQTKLKPVLPNDRRPLKANNANLKRNFN